MSPIVYQMHFDGTLDDADINDGEAGLLLGQGVPAGHSFAVESFRRYFQRVDTEWLAIIVCAHEQAPRVQGSAGETGEHC